MPALIFEPAAAAAALAVLGGAAEPIRDLLPGATLAYLAVAGRFAADLVTRGRVLPVLVAEDEGYAARWRPVLGAADAQRARELAAAMPPLCRAAGTAQATAGTVLAETLDAFADAAARTRLQAPLLPPRRATSVWGSRRVVGRKVNSRQNSSLSLRKQARTGDAAPGRC